MSINVRAAVEADCPALSRIDLTYPAGRYLHIQIAGTAPEHTFTLRWQERGEPDAVYNQYSPDWLRAAQSKADLFLVAEADGAPVGLLIVVVPSWTDGAEITDLAVDRGVRRLGAGKAFVEAAAAWARERGHRALWVEPRADNAEAIEFYLRMGSEFRGSTRSGRSCICTGTWPPPAPHRPVRLRACPPPEELLGGQVLV